MFTDSEWRTLLIKLLSIYGYQNDKNCRLRRGQKREEKSAWTVINTTVHKKGGLNIVN